MKATHAQLIERKAGYDEQWQDLVIRATRVAGDVSIRLHQTNDCQAHWDFEDALPASPLHWNAKRRAKAVATGLIDANDQHLGWLDAVSDLYKQTCAALKAVQS